MIIDVPKLEDLNFVREISPDDWMASGKEPDWYFRRGYGGLFLIDYECQRARLKPESILDFGCGHGCVARMLTARYPNAKITGQDVNPDWMNWCRETLKIETRVSEGTIDEVHLPANSFDVIWAGSVFSHLPERSAVHLLEQFRSALTPRGLCIFSTAGQVMRNGYKPGQVKFLEDSQIQQMVEAYDNDDYAYSDYNNGLYANWGHSLIPHQWMFNQSKRMGFPLIGFHEAGWGLVQDVYALRKSITQASWP
ncbi:MAG: class I SAM-dependent methyltransferase [Henriciella sp.]|nr:class I SAM-dependent methyltransferase [Henriciella sp.]